MHKGKRDWSYRKLQHQNDMETAWNRDRLFTFSFV